MTRPTLEREYFSIPFQRWPFFTALTIHLPLYVYGLALTDSLRSLINVLKQSHQPVPEELMKFGTTVKKKQHDAYGAFFKDVDMSKKSTKITFD